MKFEDLGLSETLVRGVRAQGYHTVTPIQRQAIPKVLQGHDVMGWRKPAPERRPHLHCQRCST